MKLQLTLSHGIVGQRHHDPGNEAVGRRIASQNVKHGRFTEGKTAENASQAVQRVKIRKNSSFTGASNPETITAEAKEKIQKRCQVAVSRLPHTRRRSGSHKNLAAICRRCSRRDLSNSRLSTVCRHQPDDRVPEKILFAAREAHDKAAPFTAPGRERKK